MAEIEEADGDIGSSSVRLKRGLGRITGFPSDVMTTVLYIHVLNCGPGSAGGLVYAH